MDRVNGPPESVASGFVIFNKRHINSNDLSITSNQEVRSPMVKESAYLECFLLKKPWMQWPH